MRGQQQRNTSAAAQGSASRGAAASGRREAMLAAAAGMLVLAPQSAQALFEDINKKYTDETVRASLAYRDACSVP